MNYLIKKIVHGPPPNDAHTKWKRQHLRHRAHQPKCFTLPGMDVSSQKQEDKILALMLWDFLEKNNIYPCVPIQKEAEIRSCLVFWNFMKINHVNPRIKVPIQKEATKLCNFLCGDSLENDTNSSSKNTEAPNVSWTDSGNRDTVLSFLVLEPDTELRIVLLSVDIGPLISHLGSATLGTSVNANLSRDKGIERKEETCRKNSSSNKKKKKKQKKKAKQNKKFSREHRPGEETSQTGANKGSNDGATPLPYATKFAVTSSESEDDCHGSDSEASRSTDYVSMPFINEVNASISSSPGPSVFPSVDSEHRAPDFEDGSKTKYSWYGGKILDSDNGVTLCNEENTGIHVAKLQNSTAGEGCYSPRSQLNGITAIASHEEKTSCSMQWCYAGVSYADMLLKTVKKSKTGPRNSIACSASSTGNLNGIGRDNNQSVNLEVKRNNMQESIVDSQNVDSVCSLFGVELKEETSEMKVSGNGKGKSTIELKQEFNSDMKSPQAVVASYSMCTRVEQHNEICAVSVQNSQACSSEVEPLNVRPAGDAGANRCLEKSEEKGPLLDLECMSCAPECSLMSAGQSLKEISDLPSVHVVRFKTLGNHTSGNDENLASHVEAMKKMLSKVGDAHRTQLTSEAIQLVTGFPFAEFERFLYSASPVISKSHSIRNWRASSWGSVAQESLCRCQMPNISLGRLWQWYEDHGSYGLEIRAEDHVNSGRMGLDSASFRAYFVPYLSAVQLFRSSMVYQTDAGNNIPASAAVEGSATFKEPKISSSGCIPMSSVIVPPPCTEHSQPSAVPECEKASTVPVQHGCCDDLELLFEYFESEQPHRRKPLFEMIKELVQGDAISQGRAYGDASILTSVGLRDLHPTSWYAVAWYPIYRIPGGELHAAFLTYHSLGHLVHRRPVFDYACTDPSIISPVVGLVSYKAEGECWFQPSHSLTIRNLNAAEILKERLRSLEEVATAMSRAVVIKGSELSVNRHHDYEFFLSRRRC